MSNKKLNATLTIGGAVSGSLRAAFGTVKSSLSNVTSEVRRLSREQKTLASGIDTFARMGKNVDGLRIKYAAVTAELEKQRRAQERLNVSAARQNSFGEAKTKLGGATAKAALYGASLYLPIRDAVRFETAMLGIAKQVNEAKDDAGNLTPVYYEMGRAIQKMGREIPMATNEIANMVTAGARMGIAKDDLLEFTRTAAIMSTAFEMPAAELADSMGKITGIFKIPIKDVAALGDAINYLDDNAISKGGDIIKVMQGDLAGAASIMGLSAKNAAALASTFLTLGESAERADTAASGMLRQLQIAKMNPKKFQVGVSMIGMTADQLQKGMIKAPQETILNVLDALNKLPQEKQMEAVTRLFGKDWGGAIAKLAGGVKEYRRQLELANGDKAAGSMGREMQQRMKTTAAQFEIAKNRTTELSVALGSSLLPAVNSILAAVGPVVTSVAEWSKEHRGLVTGVVAVVGGLVALKVAVMAGSVVLAGIQVALAGVAAAAGLAGIALSPLLLAAAGIAVTAAAVWGLSKALKAVGGDGIHDEKNHPGQKFVRHGRGANNGEWVTDESADQTNAGKTWKPGTRGQGGHFVDAPIPPMAQAKGAGATITDNSKTEINITQKSGEDEKSLAERISRYISEKKAVDSRSRMYDGAAAQ